MTKQTAPPVTQLLDAAGQGDALARRELWSVIYDELHRLARSQMANEPANRTLQPTALVHEAYMRLFGKNHVQWANRKHFFAAAAKTMREIRTDDARRRKCAKRGDGKRPGRLIEDPECFDQDPAEVLVIDEALARLETIDVRKARLVTLRYFAGLSRDECAAALDVSPRTVDGEWRLARAWLHRELAKGDTAAE